MTLQIGIYVFDNVDVLDFAGPYEVFTCATRVAGGPEPRFSVFTLGEKRVPVRACAGLKIDPDYALGDHPALDCLIVPGGVVTAEMEKPAVIDWLTHQTPHNHYGICLHWCFFTRKNRAIQPPFGNHPLGRHCRFEDDVPYARREK